MITSNGSSSPCLRIGAVNYLNTKPLVYGLCELLPRCEVVYDLPSRLADALAAGQLDIGLVPSIELAQHPEWHIVSDACIGSVGPVLSVKLLFRTSPSDVRSLALDEGSRTSVVLAQILLSECHGILPELVGLPIGSGPEQVDADAVLVIGDRAIHSETGPFVEVWDLGERWGQWANLPMVFAMWVARPGVAADDAATALEAARDSGCRHLHEIARQQAAQMLLPEELIYEYLSQNLHFYLGEPQRRGLEVFYQHAAKLGFIEAPPRIFVDDCPIEHS